MTRARFLLLTALIWLFPLQMVAVGGDTSAVNVSATIVSNSWCLITTPNPTLDFGTLDQTNPVDHNASTTLDFLCIGFGGSTYHISADGGLNGSSMANQANPSELIPYSLTLTPFTGTLGGFFANQTVTIDGSVQGADYQNAEIGNYADTVTVTLLP